MDQQVQDAYLDKVRAALAPRFRVEREIGRGGAATVYLAYDTRYQRQVAIKVLRPELASAVWRERFFLEIKLTARLDHPYILKLLESDQADGMLYYVMPYVTGESLRARIRREQQLPLDEAIRITQEVAEALAVAHAQGVVHRDIKPENILFEGGHPLVADFGIAKAITEAAGDRLTTTGVRIGTPGYMSPEQATGDGELDQRTDVYSVACVLYEMLAGERPYNGPSAQAIIAKQLSQPVPRLRVVRETVPPALEDVIRRGLAKVPADRYASVAELATAAARAARVSSWVQPLLPVIHFINWVLPGARLRTAALATVTVGLMAAAWRVIEGHRVRLDQSQIVVFPLAVTGGRAADVQLGQSVALAFSWALNTTSRLHAVDGWQLLEAPQREASGSVSRSTARRIARAQAAGLLVTGSVLVGDSARMLLELYDVATGENLHRVVALDRAGDPWALGLRAAGEIVRVLIGGTETLDYSVLSGHPPAALEAFLRGEQAYRRAHFKEALAQYRTALVADSSFALAAVQAAQAARWSHEEELDGSMVAALGRATALPGRYGPFARGLRAYLAFEADSAAAAFQRAIAMDARWHEAWMALGEVYTHLLPRGPPPDSMAEIAFAQVRRLDPTFAPALFHLTQIALRRGNQREASQLLSQLRSAGADTLLIEATELLVRCAAASPTAIDWRGAVRRRVASVAEAAEWFTVGGLRYPTCARTAWRALVDYDTAGSWRFAGLLGLQSVLLGQQRYDELRTLLDADSVFDPALLGDLYLMAATIGAPVRDRAVPWADTLRTLAARDSSFNTPRWWFLGIWDAFNGRPEETEQIAARLAAGATRRATNQDDIRLRRLLASSLLARAALARGDSVRAVALLSALSPSGSTQQLRWYPWESLGAEQLMLAELLLARGAAGEAWRVAGRLDATAPVPYVMFLPLSLELRERAARVLGYVKLADQLRARRARLIE